MDGKVHGKATYKYANEDEYEGEWVDEKPHARWEMEYANGAVYDLTSIQNVFKFLWNRTDILF